MISDFEWYMCIAALLTLFLIENASVMIGKSFISERRPKDTETYTCVK